MVIEMRIIITFEGGVEGSILVVLAIFNFLVINKYIHFVKFKLCI